MSGPVLPGYYKHYKGGTYSVLHVAHDSTNGPDEGRQMVVYISHTTGRINVRELGQFTELVPWPSVGWPATGRPTLEGQLHPRFMRWPEPEV